MKDLCRLLLGLALIGASVATLGLAVAGYFMEVEGPTDQTLWAIIALVFIGAAAQTLDDRGRR